MMQFAQQKRMQDIALTQKNLDLAAKQLEIQKPKIAAQFLQSTGLGGIYQEIEEGQPVGEAVSEMASRLRTKSYLGKKFDKAQSESIAGAVWSFYSAEDPEAILSLASNVYDATVMAGHPTTAEQMSPTQKRLYESFTKLGTEAEIKGVGRLASKAKISEQRISKEISEFLQGEYDIQDPIGIYADIPAALEKLDMDRRLEEQPVSASAIEMKTTRDALRVAEGRYKGLQNKMDTKMATDEEQEEFLELPGIMERYRSELGEKSEVIKRSVEGDIGELSNKIEEMKRLGLGNSPEIRALKRMVRDKRGERLDLMKDEAAERERSRVSRRIEDISELLEIPGSEAKERVEAEKTWMEGGTRWADEPGFRF
jgi:hypothetical protein